MDNDTVEKLVEIVKGHYFLYDVGHPDYKNAHRKTAVWESIGRELNHSGETVKNKWKTIRDGYTKYKKLLKTAKGSNKKIATYTWASQLTFLDDFHSPPQEPPATPTASASKSPLTRKRPSQNTRNDSKKKRSLDVVDNLFLSYAHTFKNFPAREQAIVKLELAKLFSNIELQLLDNNEYDTNFNCYASITSPASSTGSSVENQASSPSAHLLEQDIKMEVKFLDRI